MQIFSDPRCTCTTRMTLSGTERLTHSTQLEMGRLTRSSCERARWKGCVHSANRLTNYTPFRAASTCLVLTPLATALTIPRWDSTQMVTAWWTHLLFRTCIHPHRSKRCPAADTIHMDQHHQGLPSRIRGHRQQGNLRHALLRLVPQILQSHRENALGLIAVVCNAAYSVEAANCGAPSSKQQIFRRAQQQHAATAAAVMHRRPSTIAAIARPSSVSFTH